LLRRNLTRRQRNCYDKRGHFFAQAKSGNWYRIGNEWEPGIKLVKGPYCHYRWRTSYCIHFTYNNYLGPVDPLFLGLMPNEDPADFYHRVGVPRNPFAPCPSGLPPTDMIYALLLFVRHDEEHLLTTSNASPWNSRTVVRMRRGRRPRGMNRTEWDAWQACYGITEVPYHVVPEDQLPQHAIGWHSDWPQVIRLQRRETYEYD
jgi:hypothetical protein